MALVVAGEEKVGTDEDTFLRILTQRSIEHLKLVLHYYMTVSFLFFFLFLLQYFKRVSSFFSFFLFFSFQVSDFDLERSIRREMSRDLKRALVSMGTFSSSSFSLGTKPLAIQYS